MSSQESTLDPEEPQTPTWFTMLGVALFLFGGIFAVIASSGDEEETETSAAEEPAAAAAPAPEAEPAPADPHAGHGH